MDRGHPALRLQTRPHASQEIKGQTAFRGADPSQAKTMKTTMIIQNLRLDAWEERRSHSNRLAKIYQATERVSARVMHLLSCRRQIGCTRFTKSCVVPWNPPAMISDPMGTPRKNWAVFIEEPGTSLSDKFFSQLTSVTPAGRLDGQSEDSPTHE